MKKLSLFKQIAIGNIAVMLLFVVIFTINNNQTIQKQMKTLETQRISSIAKTAKPIIAINMSLELENNIKDTFAQLLKDHEELVLIQIIDTKGKVYLESLHKDIEKHHNKNIVHHRYESQLYDSLTNEKIGILVFHYDDSDSLKELKSEYTIFLIGMIILFLVSLGITTLIIKFQMIPLENLKQTLSQYTLKEHPVLKPIEGSNEISIIHNTAREMLLRIENEVKTRIAHEKRLMHKDRLESMGEMIDNIAHQWRQPLMSINAILMNLERTYELGKLDEDYLDDKLTQASELISHMSQTIEDFRHFLNPNKVKEPFDITLATKEAISLLENSFQGVMVCFDSTKAFITDGYRNELIQVFISIFNNANDVFKLRKIKEPKIFLEINNSKEDIIITIKDNAGGIKPEVITKIFDPYFTTKHKSGGTGLGLYICKVIIEESMQGEISVANSSDGAIFTIKLKRKV